MVDGGWPSHGSNAPRAQESSFFSHTHTHTHMYFFKTTNLLYSGWSRYNLRTNYSSLLSSMLCPTNHRVFLLSASLSVYFFVAGTSFRLRRFKDHFIRHLIELCFYNAHVLCWYLQSRTPLSFIYGMLLFLTISKMTSSLTMGMFFASMLIERNLGIFYLSGIYLANCVVAAATQTIYQRQIGYREYQRRGRAAL